MHAYDESYLNDAMENLGSMLDYAVEDCGLNIDEFFAWFVVSGVAQAFGNGNPRFVAGMSGVELAREVHFRATGERLDILATQALDRSRAYWTGWIMAYYQWYRALRFEDMLAAGLAPSAVAQSYVLHEADVTKFVEYADGVVYARVGAPSALARLRKLRGLTQQQLTEASGVALRMVQLYEQGRNDLNKASAETVLALSRAIGCKAEDLLA